ncbi:MAG: HAD-IC family P-type ATPase, partial [Clostridia bacterium]|nr:HAD-IC family P-type ATPase [Clostridia bacterium]
DKKAYHRATSVKGFSSATKYSAAEFDGRYAYILGAPEFLLRDDYEDFRETIEAHSSLGERVLLFAEYRYEKESREDIFEGGRLYGLVIPVALVTLVNRIRPEAKETFEYFTNQGVAIKVISGDNPLTVSRAAAEAGIPDSDKYIDASLLNTREKIEKGILEYNVFGRVTPEQKRQFIRALKKAGHTVAMTGDGVNDVLALKDADCSIAMASGSDAAANVSDLVLLDSNFACMPSVVAEGRRVINNIERSAALFLVKNIFSFILTLFTLFSVLSYPLTPAQISLVSMLMIGFPSFCLALEPNKNLVKGKFLRNILFRAFPAALAAVFVVAWSLLFKAAFGIAEDQASTLGFYLYSFVAYLMLFRVCKPMNFPHKLLFGSMGALFLLACTVIPHWFDLVPLTFGSWLILAALIIIAYFADRGILYVFNHFGSWVKKAKDFVTRSMDGEKTAK